MQCFSCAQSARRHLGIVGANVGKNKDTVDAAVDYELGIEAVCAHADYLVCNVSSPNTPGLRGLQDRAEIEKLLARVLAARARAAAGLIRPPPLLAKVGPDLNEDQVHDIAQVALASGIDGLIVGNTTVERPGMTSSPRWFWVEVSTSTHTVTATHAGLATLNLALAVSPSGGTLATTGTEARNVVRFA